MEGSAALPRTADDSRLCKGVDCAVLVPRRSDGDARLWCDADLRSSEMRGSVACWPEPALAGYEATSRFQCQTPSSPEMPDLLLNISPEPHCSKDLQAAVSKIAVKLHIANSKAKGGVVCKGFELRASMFFLSGARVQRDQLLLSLMFNLICETPKVPRA